MTSEFPRPRLVSAPEVLHDSDGWVLWHSGVTDGPHGLQTVVEVIDTSGRDRVTGPAWNVGERDRWPIEVTATEGATDPVTPKAFSEESTLARTGCSYRSDATANASARDPTRTNPSC